MPELAEVESFRRLAEAVAVGRTIRSATRAESGVELPLDEGWDAIVLKDRPDVLKQALVGRKIIGAHRKGKLSWLALDDETFLMMHFGMSGQLRSPDSKPLVLSSSPKRDLRGFPPKFTRLLLAFSGGGALAFCDGRRLGRVWLSNDPKEDLANLGFDALHEVPEPEAFLALFFARRGRIKSLLLDQSFAAGVGNWIADEVLFQARIDPRRNVSSFNRLEALSIRAAIKSVVEIAAHVNADSSRFPSNWLFHARWGRAQDAKTESGEPIEFLKIGGRTTAWVPSRQR